MKSPLFPLQQALYGRLTASLSCPVYDQVPEGAAYPYVTLGEDTAADWSTKLTPGQEVTHTLHVWSRAAGFKECKQIGDQVIQSLTGAALAVAGFRVEVVRLEMNEVLRDPDGVTRHGVIRFRFNIWEVA